MGKRQTSIITSLQKGNHFCNNSSFHGVTISTSPRRLVKLALVLESNYEENNDGKDKTNFEFEFKTDTGISFSVYDWKEYRPLQMDRIYQFHIAGKSKSDTLFAKDKLLQALMLM